MLLVVVDGNSHHIDPKWFVGEDDHSQDESCFRSISEDSSTAVEVGVVAVDGLDNRTIVCTYFID